MIVVDYSPLPGLKGSVLAPIIPVTFFYNRNEFSTFALIDSGVSRGVISTIIAEALGIDWEKIPVKTGLSVASSIRCHPAKLTINIYNFKSYLTVDIVEGLAPYKCILG